MHKKERQEEALLYYLYMMSDGEIKYSEEKIFNEICKDIRLDEDDRSHVVTKCKKIIQNHEDILGVIKSEKLYKRIGSGRNDISTFGRVLWNLINLGYADEVYSHEERGIVKYLLDKWNIKKEIYLEMMDTADTMRELSKQKEWIISTFPRGSERDQREKEVDLAIASLLSDVKCTIDELSI